MVVVKSSSKSQDQIVQHIATPRTSPSLLSTTPLTHLFFQKSASSSIPQDWLITAFSGGGVQVKAVEESYSYLFLSSKIVSSFPWKQFP